MRKRIIIIFIVLMNLCLLSSCYVDIDQQITVSGMAIDVGHQGKKYHVSVETVSVSDEKITTDVIETDGDTVFEALRDLIAISSKKLYFGHCKVMFISEELAKNGIGEVLDLTIRDHEARIEMDILITKGCDAKDALMTDGVFSPIVCYKVDELFDTPEKPLGDAPAVHSYKVYNDINSDGVSAVIPTFKIISVEDKKELKLCGTGVFKRDKLIGYLDEQESRNLSIINNKIKSGLLTYKAEDETESFISYEILKNKSKTAIKFDDDNKIRVDVTIKTDVNIGEIDTKADFTKSDEVKKIAQNLENKMERDLYKLIDKAQSELESDIFGIGRQIYRNHPRLWEEYKEGWDETFKTVDFNVDCKVTIIGSGTFNKGSLSSHGKGG